MPLGKASKLAIFIIVLNATIAFAGTSGMSLGDDVDFKTAQDFLSSQENQTQEVKEGFQEQKESSGIISGTLVDYVGKAWEGIWFIGLFANPPLMAAALPNPLGAIMAMVFAGLEISALVTILRGVAI